MEGEGADVLPVDQDASAGHVVEPRDQVAKGGFTTLLASVRRIVEFTEQFQRGMTGIERFIEVIDAPVDIEDAPDASELGQVEGNIRFEQVGFHYADDPAPVLADINLTVKPGESVALVVIFP